MDGVEARETYSLLQPQHPSMTDLGLQDVFQQLAVEDIVDGHTMNEEVARPQKRRRLDLETALVSNVSNYDGLVGMLYQLLSTQGTTELEGLHLVTA